MFKKSLAAASAVIASVAMVSTNADAHTFAHGKVRIGKHRVVRHSKLPHCAIEDASRGPIPCSWNFADGHVDGNGQGLSFFVTGSRHHQHVHYVWAVDPRHGRWHWVNSSWADAMAESGEKGATTRNWEACIIKIGGTTFIECPNGDVFSS
jgi:hypothetical protein